MTDELITGSKDQPSRFDGFLKAKEGELIFTLLERDKDAPGAILHWCELRRTRARKELKGDALKAELAQINEAEEIAWEMQRRQKGHETREDEPKRESYSGINLDADNAWREQMAQGVTLLHNATADIADAKSIFDSLDLLDLDDVVMLDSAMNITRTVAVERSPKHASFAERPTLAMLKAGQ